MTAYINNDVKGQSIYKNMYHALLHVKETNMEENIVKFFLNRKLATRISIFTTVLTLVGMLSLWRTVSDNVVFIVKNDITNQLTDAVESRASIINDYVASAEEYVEAFALGSDVHELLRHPNDSGLLSRGQKYTEDFAKVKGIFEGLYIATPETLVLTHTSREAVGMTTRTGDSLKSFRNTILAQSQLTNLGIMKSPGTGSMILSMYCPVFEGKECIGYVGAGVYANRLMDALLNLDIEGLPDTEYVFINVENGVYIYHQDESLLNTETEDSGYQQIIRRIQENGSDQVGAYSYQDENGIKQLIVYKYLKERNWVFMVRDTEAEVYGAVDKVRLVVGMLCAFVAASIILITLFLLRRQGKELMVVENAIRRLGNLDLSVDQELEAFYGRKDEIGLIAQTTHNVCEYLRKTIDDIGRILGEMADGNISVDVSKNEEYYIGDVKILSKSLKTIQNNLLEVMRGISYIANQVDVSAEQVSAGVQTLSQGTAQQSDSIEGLVSNVTEITTQIKNSAIRCSDASELVDKANGYAEEADAMMEQLLTATRNIDQSSAKICNITGTIEDIAFQTNLLALNASVEASHAGTSGKGFAVVADEVRNLAAKSGEAAQNTGVLVRESILDVKTGTESTDHVISAMKIINDCIESVKSLMDDIALASAQQSEMIASIEERIKEISRVVQTSSATAEESAVASKEMSEQAKVLNRLIGQFRIQ